MWNANQAVAPSSVKDIEGTIDPAETITTPMWGKRDRFIPTKVYTSLTFRFKNPLWLGRIESDGSWLWSLIDAFLFRLLVEY